MSARGMAGHKGGVAFAKVDYKCLRVLPYKEDPSLYIRVGEGGGIDCA